MFCRAQAAVWFLARRVSTGSNCTDMDCGEELLFRLARTGLGAALQAIESIESTSNASLDGCLVAKKLVESVALRNDVLRYRHLPKGGRSI